MKNLGIKLLYGTFTQLIVIVIAYEFYRRFAMFHGGVSGAGVLSNINPLIWIVLIIELIYSIVLIRKDNKKVKSNKKPMEINREEIM